MLDSLQRAVLTAIGRLTRDNYGDTDGAAIVNELKTMGYEPDEMQLYNLMRSFRDDGYISADAYFGSGAAAFHFIRLTPLGREEAHETDPFERVFAEARHGLGSAAFADSYPSAFEAWATAEELLSQRSASNLTAIGHHVREAMQAFATAMVEQHLPPAVDPDPAMVERRLGAVIDIHRQRLGDARREALEALGTLWTKVNQLVQRQEHGAKKEGEAVTWSDARRIVYLSMFCMLEFAVTFEDIEPDPPAYLEGGH